MKRSNNYYFYTKWITVLVLAMLLPSLSALAQSENRSQRQDRRGMDLGSITVTAQKQEENVQEVPVSISVLGMGFIEDAGIKAIVDLADYVPNLFMYEQGPGVNLPTMRGISAPTETYQVSTGLYVDGAPIITTTGYTIGLLDVERVEVLRGPQGTLYGNGAQAGVINIITRKPGNEFTGQVSAQAGSWLSSEADDLLVTTSLYAGGAIVPDKFFWSMSGQFEQKDGYIQNILTGEAENDREDWFGKGNLYWSPTDKLDLSLIVSRMDNNADNTTLNMTEAGYASMGYPYPGYRKMASDLPGQFYDTAEDLQTLKADFSFTDELTLTSITANWRSDATWHIDYDFTPYLLSHAKAGIESKRLSEELRLNYVKGKLKGLVGFYVDDYERRQPFEWESMYPSYQTKSDDEVSANTYAFFGNLTYPVTEKFSVTAGLRYESTDQDFEDKINGVKLDESWDDVTPKLVLDYAITPAAMVYASAAKGFRSGGFNGTYATTDFLTYDPEELWSYEVGTKTAFLDNKLVLNAALFYMNISDMQVNQRIPNGQSYMTNAAEATSKGVEIEIIWYPVQGLSLSAGFGYTDVEFDEFGDAAGDYQGNKNPWAPEYTFNIGAQYRHRSGWYARADVNGVGEMFFDKANMYSIDSYVLVNAKLGYEWERVDMYLYGNNIFDEKQDYDAAFGGVTDLLNEPGEAGLRVVYRF